MKKKLLIFTAFFLSIYSYSQDKLKKNSYQNIFNEAAVAIEKNEYKKTVEILDRINKNDSTFHSATITKTYYLLQNENYDEVIKICDANIKDFKGDNKLSLLVNKGVALEGLKKYDESITVYNEALKLYPKHHLLWYNKGTSLALLEKNEEALAALKISNTYNPLYKSTHLQIGDIYYKYGKTTQALMCYNIYTILNLDSDNSNEMLLALNIIATQENPNESKNFKNTNEDIYEELDLIVKSNMALNKDYDIGNEFNFPLIKQNHAILEKISEIENDDSFFSKRYLALHRWIKENNYFNDYTYTTLYGIENKKYQKKIKKHTDDIVSFYQVFKSKWLELNSKNIAIVNGIEKEYDFLFSEEGTLEAAGLLEDGKKIGVWDVYNESGQLSLTANFNDKENKDKEWKWFYSNGKVKEIANYTDNVFEGASVMFHEDGKKYIETQYQSGKLNGNYKYYNKNGALIQNKNFKDGLLEGVYKSYFPVGEELIEYNVPYKEDAVEGLFTEYYANGDVFYEVNYKEGKKQGIEKTYYYNKVLMKEIAFVDGKMNGMFKFYSPKGILVEEGTTEDDLYVGEWKLYFEDGTFQKSYNYEKGYIEGISKFYDRDSKLHYEFEYKKSDVIAYKYYRKDGSIIKEGKKKRGAFFFESYSPEGNILMKGNYNIKGGRTGVWEFFTKNGVLERKCNFSENNLNGETIGYYTDGSIEYTSNYVDDALEGYYVGYHDNGQMEHQGYYEKGLTQGEWRYYYKDGTIESINFFHKGDLHGEQEYFNPEGKIYKNVDYIYGNIEKEVIYDVNGKVFEEVDLQTKKGNYIITYKHYNNKIHKEINYVNGVKHGVYKSYDFYGNKRIVGDYVNGKLHGEWKWFYKNGKVESVRNYILGELFGKSTDNFENGAVEETQTLFKDENEGEDIYYFENGNIDRKSTFLYGKYHGRREFYSVSGELQLIRFYNHGRLTGYSYLDTTGKEVEMIPLENESGKIKAFYQNGKVSREIEFDKGNFINEYKAFYPDGTLENIIKYNKEGKLSGVEKEFHSNGKVKIERPYVLGKLNGVYKEYYKNGQLKTEKTYINSDLNGVTKNYDETGKLLNEEKYFNDTIYEVSEK